MLYCILGWMIHLRPCLRQAVCNAIVHSVIIISTTSIQFQVNDYSIDYRVSQIHAIFAFPEGSG